MIGYSKHIKISYRADMQTAIIRWQQPVTFSEFQENCQAILELAKEHAASSWLLDCRSKGEVTQEESDWLSNELYPQLLAHVAPHVVIAWLLNPRQMQRLQEGATLYAISSECPDVARRAFLTEQEAVSWLEQSVAQIAARGRDQV